MEDKFKALNESSLPFVSDTSSKLLASSFMRQGAVSMQKQLHEKDIENLKI
jgi:hypothetical protein